MKTFTRFLDVPAGASYLGSENGDGSLEEEIAEYVEDAFEPACYLDADGIRHFFDLG